MKKNTRKWLSVSATLIVAAATLFLFGAFGNAAEDARQTTLQIIFFAIVVLPVPGYHITPFNRAVHDLNIYPDWFSTVIFCGIAAGFVAGFIFAAMSKKNPTATGAAHIKKQYGIIAKTILASVVLALPLSVLLNWEEYSEEIRKNYPNFYEATRDHYPRALFLLPRPGGRD